MDLTAPSPQDPNATSASDSGSFPGITPGLLPGYEIITEIQRGGQGVVYKALQKSTKRLVAIKVMKEGPFAGSEGKARFEREVRILAQLSHPNIVPIHDSGIAAGNHYFVMGYIDGVSLDKFVETQRVALDASKTAFSAKFAEKILTLFATICDAISAAHERGIVHRDLKPGNIKVDIAGVPHILDFGLARTIAGHYEGGTQDPTVTMSGHFMGSLAWASPEQAGGNSRIDTRSDVYSLGVILYQMLTDRLPYDVVGPIHEVLERIIRDQPTPPSSFVRNLGSDLETIVLKCLNKEPDRRYQSAAELGRDVRHYLAGEPIEAKRDSLAYSLRKRGQVLVNRHKVVAMIAVVAVISPICFYLGNWLIYDFTKFNNHYMRFMASNFEASTFGPALDHVRMIAINNDSNLEALAKSIGVNGYSDSNRASARMLHGRLCEKLAHSGAKAVAFDITFTEKSDFDGELLNGIKSLQSAGIPIIVAHYGWWANYNGIPKLSPVITPLVFWGADTADCERNTAWRVHLVMRRSANDPLPSLALATYAACLHPDAEMSVDFNSEDESVRLEFRRPDTELPQVRHKIPDDEANHIQLSSAYTWDKDKPAVGYRKDDQTGYLAMDMPSDEVLAASTTEFSKVFTLDDAALQKMFTGKIILVCRQQEGGDKYEHPKERKLWGSQCHAVALDLLFKPANRSAFNRPRDGSIWVMTIFCAAIGCLVAYFSQNRHRRRVTIFLLTLLGFAISIVAFRQFSILYDPLVPLIALILASEFSLGSERRGVPV